MRSNNCPQIRSFNILMQISREVKKNQPSADVKKENAALADQYNPKGLFPYTLLLNADGKILKTWEGLPSEDAATFSREIRHFDHKK